MGKKYIVALNASERHQLEELVNKGRALARKRLHAQILLKADDGPFGPGWTDEQLAADFPISVRGVERIRQRLVKNGLEDALVRRQSEQAPRCKLDGTAEAKLIALACTPAPEGRRRWTIRLLADKMVQLEIVDSLGRETVRQALKKTKSSPG